MNDKPNVDAPFSPPNFADPKADGFAGTFVEKKTGRVFTLKTLPGAIRSHLLITVDHAEGAPLLHHLSPGDFERLFEKQ